ncbi:MAG TPA: PQQ-dependent sugar dehydrogenase [Methylomirabilota bacterium]|nr:PQQ-dependent sugar dehydrogenase [Methylomirabilota bacterium]
MNTKLSIITIASCIVATAVGAETKPSLKLIAEGFVSPTALVPIDNGRALITDQLGKISLLNKDGKLGEKVVLDLGSKLSNYNTNAFDERGVVGAAVHPQFANNKKFYLFYSAPLRETAPTNWDHTVRLSEFTLAPDDTAGNERVLLEIDMPYFNHHGGRMAFGPDGLLYVAVGDGGNANDIDAPPGKNGLIRGRPPEGNGQSRSTLMGKVLRIDVNNKDAGKQYAVPKDNPFVNGGGLPEIFAYGLRNPWGLAFDRAGDRELFLAEVGQDSWEEINIIKKGGNYGWNIREGLVCFDPKKPRNPPDDCPKVGANGEPLIEPILTYKNGRKWGKDPEVKGISITGGYIYRGKAFPQLAGKYVFGDWSRNFVIPDGVLYVASKGPDGKWTMEALELANNATGAIKLFVLALGEDAEGELYVLTNTSSALRGANGKVWKLAKE